MVGLSFAFFAGFVGCGFDFERVFIWDGSFRMAVRVRPATFGAAKPGSSARIGSAAMRRGDVVRLDLLTHIGRCGFRHCEQVRVIKNQRYMANTRKLIGDYWTCPAKITRSLLMSALISGH